MKTLIYRNSMRLLSLLVITSLILSSCNEGDSINGSQIDTSTPVLSDLDVWIRNNYIAPYNIEIQYEWDENEVDLNRFLFPPRTENVQPLLEAILEIWVEPYEEFGGNDFIKRIAPRQFTLVGGTNRNPSGTITLGLAEAGTKITLFNVDDLDLKNLASTRRFFETIHHEYAHILNQTVRFDDAFGLINPQFFTAQWFNVSVANAREMGFITNYALTNESEDFAEMVSTMLTTSRAEYNAIVDGISNQTARSDIRLKEQFVVSYFADEFGIDFYELQERAYNNTLEVINR